MNKAKMNEVGELLEVDASDIKETKFKTLIKRYTYPLIQIGFFIVSSISGVLLGFWQKQIHPGYPYSSFTRIYRASIPTLLIIHSGNTLFSLKTNRKYGFSKFQAVTIVIINLILSTISFFLLYQLLADQVLGLNILYGSYRKKVNRLSQSNVIN